MRLDLKKFDKFGVDGVTLLLGKGRKDESGDVTAGAGLAGSQIDVLVEFISPRTTTRSETARKVAKSVGRKRSGGRGVGEAVEYGLLITTAAA